MATITLQPSVGWQKLEKRLERYATDFVTDFTEYDARDIAHNHLEFAKILCPVRTGEMAHDPEVRAGLGLQQSDRIVGFIYLGTAATPPKPLQPIDHATHFAEWLPGTIAFAASAG